MWTSNNKGSSRYNFKLCMTNQTHVQPWLHQYFEKQMHVDYCLTYSTVCPKNYSKMIYARTQHWYKLMKKINHMMIITKSWLIIFVMYLCYLSTYLPNYLTTYVANYLSTYQAVTYLLKYLPTYLGMHLCTYLKYQGTLAVYLCGPT